MLKLPDVFKLVTSFEHDTRRIKKGALYIAIKGENLDGHDFVKEAEEKGATACVVERKINNVDIPQIIVDDSVKAYGELAVLWREKVKYPLVAITGSNGKTTTKDIIYKILSARHRVVKTQGNFNNLIGVPYTVLNFPLDADHGIVEFGMNAKGEIARLSEITRPQVALITNIGRAHIGKLGSLEKVAEAKLELFHHMLGKPAVFIINADDKKIFEWFNRTRPSNSLQKFILFSCLENKEADVVVKNMGGDSQTQKFELCVKNNSPEYGTINLPGEHNLCNIAAGVAVANYFGVTSKECVAALKDFVPPSMRSTLTIKDDVEYMVDCYNANPDSMSAALRSCAKIQNAKRHIAVIGDMMELDGMEPELHTEIGRLLGELKYDFIFAVGNYSKYYEQGLKSISATGNIKVYALNEMEKLKKDIKSFVEKGDAVLVKASRAVELEKIFE
ncbi:MAG: UDP-N-acetylmuramoyl-tripeptide--D-alanyl-D-alanine ligase [Pseudomonadota bacterium]